MIDDDIVGFAKNSPNRESFWCDALNHWRSARAAEIGVYKGMFAENILRNVASIEQYFMIDPWRHLDDWNKQPSIGLLDTTLTSQVPRGSQNERGAQEENGGRAT